MTYLEKLATIYVASHLAYMCLCVARDLKLIRDNSLKKHLLSERETYARNLSVLQEEVLNLRGEYGGNA